MPSVVSTMASAISSPIDPSQSQQYVDGSHTAFNREPLRNRKTRTYARAGDVFTKKRTLSHSLEELKPQLGAKPGAKSKAETHNYPRISRPVELLKREYDVVVIGSGYGGSVAASRMARAGQSVCVLELGREKWPGEYPETTKKAWSQLHVSGEWAKFDANVGPISMGGATSLYNLVIGRGQNVFVAHGLGGTSLLNANVFLEADEKTLEMSPWPSEIRNDPSCLKPYYQRAREMLQPVPYPKDWPRLPKMEMLRKQAEALGLGDKFREVDQTTWFEDGLNSSGVQMKKSTLSGMDTTGVNDGSKSSTLMNYLADAWNWGAEIYCACEVRHIEKHPEEGYLIYFAWHGCQRHEFKDIFYQDLMWVHAKKFVFVGAGALGSTEILLRSKEQGLNMSNHVGKKMSGNGDMLAFGYNMKETVGAISNPRPPLDQPVGPTITGIIDCRDQNKPAREGFVIEEGVVPSPLLPFMQIMLEALPHKDGSKSHTTNERFHRLLARASSRFGHYYSLNGSLEKTMVYLVMSHDDNQATLTLDHDKPFLQFKGVGQAEHVQKLKKLLGKASDSQDGEFEDNPFSAIAGQEISVHPIGGASMSRNNSIEDGVTNHLGEVLVGENGEVHDGLVVMDGSVIPTSLGANPFATITAIAERSVEKLAEKKGLTIDYHTKNGELNFFGKPEHPIPEKHVSKDAKFVREALVAHKHGLEFTEIMKGHIHVGQYIKDYDVAERVAKGHCEEARFFLSAHAYDADTFLASDEKKAMLTGTFTSAALPKSPYMVTEGCFELFSDDPNAPDTKNFTYEFDMVGTDGSKLHFSGKKIINDLATFSILGTWRATTTLRVTLTDPEKPEEPEGANVIGRGILYISPHDFIHELKTFYSSLYSAKQFVSWFTKELAHVFFAPFSLLDWPEPYVQSWTQKNSPKRIFDVTAEDGVSTRLKMWEPLEKPRHRDMDILFLPGAAVDETIFALDTVPTNALTYFRKLGYRCFCLTHRVGKTKLAKHGWTTYDARLDVAAAIKKIEALRDSADFVDGRPYRPLESSKTYVIAHCAGSVALSMALLDGSVDASSIAGITASNVFMDPIFAWVNQMKASSPVSLPGVYETLARSHWFDCSSAPSDPLVQLALNQVLRLYPVPTKTDICNSVVCHRSSLVFGMLWKHSNLNDATHRHLEKIIGGTTMTDLKHFMAMGMKRTVLTSKGADSLRTNGNLERLKGIPIFFFSGVENSVYDPISTRNSYDRLCDLFDPGDYDREEIPGYGHLDCWMGPKAHEDVYPLVFNHIKKVERGEFRKGTNGVVTNGVNGVNGHAH